MMGFNISLAGSAPPELQPVSALGGAPPLPALNYFIKDKQCANFRAIFGRFSRSFREFSRTFRNVRRSKRSENDSERSETAQNGVKTVRNGTKMVQNSPEMVQNGAIGILSWDGLC